MFGSGEGYRPGRITYTINGMPASEREFMAEVNTGRIGGAFGLLEIAARMSSRSVRDYSVRFKDGNMPLERFFGNEGDAIIFAGRMNQTTVYRNINESWSILASLSPRVDNLFTETPLTDKDKEKLEGGLKNLTSDLNCNKFITNVLEKLKATGRAGYETTDINKLFGLIFNNNKNEFLSVNYLEVWDKKLVELVPLALTSFSNAHDESKKTTTIRFDSLHFGFSEGNISGRKYQFSKSDATLVLVHELIHAFGKNAYFSHMDQAQTAYEIATALGKKVDAPPNESDYIDEKTGKLKGGPFDDANSSYFGKILEAISKIVSEQNEHTA